MTDITIYQPARDEQALPESIMDLMRERRTALAERDAITDGMPGWVQAAGWQARIAWNEDPAWRTRAQTASPIEQGALILRATMLYTSDPMAIIRPQESEA